MDKLTTKAAQLTETQLARDIWTAYKQATGATQSEVAKSWGMSQGSFNGYLQGQHALNTDFILKLSKLTGCMPQDIRPSLADFPAFISEQDVALIKAFRTLSPDRKRHIMDSIAIAKESS